MKTNGDFLGGEPFFKTLEKIPGNFLIQKKKAIWIWISNPKEIKKF